MAKYIWTTSIPVERSIGGVVIDTEYVDNEVELFIPEVTVRANGVAVCPVYMSYNNTQQLIKFMEFSSGSNDAFASAYEYLLSDSQFEGVRVEAE